MCAYVSTYVCAGRVTCACEYEKPEVSIQLVFFCLSVPCSLSPSCLRNGSLNSALTLSATLAGLECPQLPPPDMLASQPDALHLTSHVGAEFKFSSDCRAGTISADPSPSRPHPHCLILLFIPCGLRQNFKTVFLWAAPGRPRTQRAASAFQGLGLNTCASTPSFCLYCFPSLEEKTLAWFSLWSCSEWTESLTH